MEENKIQQEEHMNQGVDMDNVTPEAEVLEEEKVQEQSEDLLQKEKDKFIRLFAEFENYKKRTSRERIELFKTAGQEVLSAMLPVLDDFDRALTEISKTQEKDVLKGVELIYNKFLGVLKSKGLSAVEVQPGDIFNSDMHEAVTQIPAPTEDMKGKIIDVLEKGYQLSDKIIRYPKVVVGQ